MPNHNYSGPGNRVPDEDENHSHERDREFGRDREFRSTERQGQGQSGYSAGRHGDDPAQGYQNRSPSYPGGFDDRPANRSGMGLDDRFERTDHPDRPARGYGYERDTGYRASRNAITGSGQEERRDHQRGRSGSQGSESGYGGSGAYRYDLPRGHGERAGDDRSSGVYRGMGGHRGKGPQNWQRSDERIRELVNEALTDHDHIDATNILVTVAEGEVTLSGTVEDRSTKRLAEDCVEQIVGVKEVQNHLRIQRHDGRGTGPESSVRIASSAPGTNGDRKPRA